MAFSWWTDIGLFYKLPWYVFRMAGSDSKLPVNSRLVRLQIELFAFVSSGITIVYLYISMYDVDEYFISFIDVKISNSKLG